MLQVAGAVILMRTMECVAEAWCRALLFGTDQHEFAPQHSFIFESDAKALHVSTHKESTLPRI